MPLACRRQCAGNSNIHLLLRQLHRGQHRWQCWSHLMLGLGEKHSGGHSRKLGVSAVLTDR